MAPARRLGDLGAGSGDPFSRGACHLERRAGVAHGAQVAWCRESLHAARHQALEVAHARERVAEVPAPVAVSEQHLDRVRVVA